MYRRGLGAAAVSMLALSWVWVDNSLGAGAGSPNTPRASAGSPHNAQVRNLQRSVEVTGLSSPASAGPAAAGGGNVVWDNGFDMAGAAASPACQSDGTFVDTDRFAIVADNFQVSGGTTINGFRARFAYFNPAMFEAFTGVWVIFWQDAGGAPSNTILDEFQLMPDSFTVVQDTATVVRVQGDFDGAIHVASGAIEWVSIIPLVTFPPQTAWLSTSELNLTPAFQDFDPANGTANPWTAPDPGVLTTDVEFQLLGEAATGGSTVLTITNGPGMAGCALRMTPTTAPITACNGGMCPATFGNNCFANIANTSGIPAATLANLLAVNLQNAINGNQCGSMLSVQAVGPRVILRTSDGARPRPCISVGGTALGIVGGPTQCELNGCSFHFQVGPNANQVLPPIGASIDFLTTDKACTTNPGQGTWTVLNLPQGFFDRTANAAHTSQPFNAMVAMSGVGRNFSSDDSDTAIERLEDGVFGRCSGDFTRPNVPAGQRSPDGLVDATDQAGFTFCQMQGPAVGDCRFFDYDGDNDIDAADLNVFNCLLNSENNPQCCPANTTLPQGTSEPVTTTVRRLHLRGCDYLDVNRVGLDACPEKWQLDVYLSGSPAQVGGGAVGPCETGIDTEPNNVQGNAENLGLLALGAPRQIAGRIGGPGATACDVGVPVFAGSFDADVYRFTIAFDDTVNLNVRDQADTTGCAVGAQHAISSLWLFDSDGAVVAFHDPGLAGNPTLSAALTPGAYFALVASAGQVAPPDITPAVGVCSIGGEPFDGQNDGTGVYELNLSVAPKSSMNIRQTSSNGGTFDSTLLVQPLLAYTKVCDPLHSVLVDTGDLGLDAVILRSQNGAWVRRIIDPALTDALLPNDPNFIPGVRQLDGVDQEVAPLQHQDPSGGQYLHRVEPPQPPKCQTLVDTCVFIQAPDEAQTVDAVGAAISGDQDFRLAEDFMVTAPTMISSVTFWTTPAGVVSTDYVFGVRVLNDGALMGGCNGPNANSIVSDGVDGEIIVRQVSLNDIDQITVNLAQPFPAQMGVRYWLELVWDADLSPSTGDQPFFVTSQDGNNRFFHDLIPAATGVGDGCDAAADGNGYDCINSPDDAGTADCDESDPAGDQEMANIAICVRPTAVAHSTKDLPEDVSCGSWRTSSGQTIWTQPFGARSDGIIGFFSDVASPAGPDGRQAADRFVFFQNTMITDLHWRGSYTTNTPAATDNFTIEFYSDDNDLPGSLIGVQVPPAAQIQRIAGQLAGDPGRQIWEYSYNLNPPLSVNANQLVWVSIFNNNTGATYQWAFSNGVGGNSDGFAATRNIGEAWMTEGPDASPETDFSFDLTVGGTTKIVCGDSIGCAGPGPASGLGYRFDPDFCIINGLQEKMGDPESNGNRWRVVRAPWKMFDEFSPPNPLPLGQAGALLTQAGISQEELACLTQNVNTGSKLVAGVFRGLAAYDADPDIHGVGVEGRIERICNGAVIEQVDPNDALSERLQVKGICWSNNTATFVTRVGGAEPEPAPRIVHETTATASTTPCSGYVDPRIENLNSVPPLLHTQGLNRVRILFDRPVFAMGGGPVGPGSFVVTSLSGVAPTVATVTDVSAGESLRFELTFSGLIPLQTWTTVRAVVQNSEGTPIVNLGDLGPLMNEPDRMDYAAHPGNVDQSNAVSPIDLLRFRQRINNACPMCPSCGGEGLFFDMDRNLTFIQPLDLLRMRQIVTGAPPATRNWSQPPNSSLPARP